MSDLETGARRERSTDIVLEQDDDDSVAKFESLAAEVDDLKAEIDLQRSLREEEGNEAGLRLSLREKEAELQSFREELLETERENAKLKRSILKEPSSQT